MRKSTQAISSSIQRLEPKSRSGVAPQLAQWLSHFLPRISGDALVIAVNHRESIAFIDGIGPTAGQRDVKANAGTCWFDHVVAEDRETAREHFRRLFDTGSAAPIRIR